MKYTQLLTIAALTAQAQASCESHVESELATLMDIVESLENEDSNLVSTIQARKDELQRLSEDEPECQQRYLSELESLSNLVDAVEEENFESFVKSLESRKDQLVQMLGLSQEKEVQEATPARAKDGAKKDAYEAALVGLYSSLPPSTQAQLMTSVKALDISYKTYVAANGKDLRHMSAAQFQTWAKNKTAPAKATPAKPAKKLTKEEQAAADKKAKDDKAAAEKKAAEDKAAKEGKGKGKEEKKAKDEKKGKDEKKAKDEKKSEGGKDEKKSEKSGKDEKKSEEEGKVSLAKEEKKAEEKKGEEKKGEEKKGEEKKAEEKKGGEKQTAEEKKAAEEKATKAAADKKAAAEKKAAADKKAAAAKPGFKGKAQLIALQKSGVAFETLCLNAPEAALKDASLNKATVFAFPGAVKVDVGNNKVFNDALVAAFTQAKLTTYNKFGTDLTVQQKAVTTAQAGLAPFLVKDATSTPMFPLNRMMTQAEVTAKVTDKSFTAAQDTAFKALVTGKTKVEALTTANAALTKNYAVGKPLITAFDAEVTKLVALPAHKDTKAPNALLVAPTTHRAAFAKVEAAHTKYTAAVAQDDSAAATAEKKHQLIEKAKKNSGAIAIGLGITALLVTVAGVVACKYKKTCCFKDSDQMEGGDRALYKQEFKKSHKKHAKESLVPAFDVQA